MTESHFNHEAIKATEPALPELSCLAAQIEKKDSRTIELESLRTEVKNKEAHIFVLKANNRVFKKDARTTYGKIKDMAEEISALKNEIIESKTADFTLMTAEIADLKSRVIQVDEARKAQIEALEKTQAELNKARMSSIRYWRGIALNAKVEGAGIAAMQQKINDLVCSLLSVSG
jgi:predicted  nucleic acid-binding Zn-ribbon protein